MTAPAPSTATATARGPNCWQCRFFAVSWDPRLPYACQLMGIKTAALPAWEVLRADGRPCQGFVPKAAAPAPQASAQTAAARSPLASGRKKDEGFVRFC